MYRPVNVESAALRALRRFPAAVTQAPTDVTAFTYLHAPTTFFDPFGITQPFPLKNVIGLPCHS